MAKINIFSLGLQNENYVLGQNTDISFFYNDWNRMHVRMPTQLSRIIPTNCKRNCIYQVKQSTCHWFTICTVEWDSLQEFVELKQCPIRIRARTKKHFTASHHDVKHKLSADKRNHSAQKNLADEWTHPTEVNSLLHDESKETNEKIYHVQT